MPWGKESRPRILRQSILAKPPAERPNLPPGLPPAIVEPVSPRALKRMKVSELREALSERGLPTNGKRDELVARLELLSRLESADAVNPLASPNLEAACSSVAAPSEEGTASSASTQLAQGTSATSRGGGGGGSEGGGDGDGSDSGDVSQPLLTLPHGATFDAVTRAQAHSPGKR